MWFPQMTRMAAVSTLYQMFTLVSNTTISTPQEGCHTVTRTAMSTVQGEPAVSMTTISTPQE